MNKLKARQFIIHLPQLVLGAFYALWMLLFSGANIFAQTANQPVLTNIVSIRRLKPDEANLNPPVSIKGTIVYFNPAFGDLFINDGTFGVYLNPLSTNMLVEISPRLGMSVEVQGAAIAGDFSPSVWVSQMKVIGEAPLPVPVQGDYFRLASGRLDSQWVALEGLVVDLTETDSFTELLIRNQGRTIPVHFPFGNLSSLLNQTRSGTNKVQNLLWNSVRLRGVVSGIFSKQRGLIVPKFLCPGIEFLEVISSPNLETKELPRTLASDVLSFDPDGQRRQGVKIKGVVTAITGPKKFLLQDESGGLEVRLISEAKVYVGNQVSVLGFPESEEFFPRLSHAQTLGITNGKLPEAQRITMAEIIDGVHLGKRVELEGVIKGKGVSLATGGVRFDLVEDQVPIVVHLPAGMKELTWPVGTRLKVRAAHVLQTDLLQRTSRLILFPAGEYDLIALYQPREWPTKSVIVALSILGIFGCAAFFWNQQLRRNVRVKTHELITANQTKTRFIRNISHEIRTPLHGIIATADLLGRTPLNPEQFDFLRYLQRSAEGLLHLINDILDVSKIEAGKLTLDIAPFDLRKTATEVVELLRSNADQKGVAMQMKFTGRLPPMLVGDQFRVRQILFNLLGNAIKFTEQGTVGLDIDVQEVTLSDARVTFTVHDTGVGIPQEDQARLFKPFSQVDSSSKRRFEGSGLGLVICRELVDMMGGEIHLQSKSGEGSEFSFTLTFPIASSKTEGLQPLAKDTSDTETLRRFEGLKILVAEDTLLNAHLLKVMLQKFGCAATFVVNGKEAVEAVQKEQYDLVLMDCQMPVMDGLQATSMIRGIKSDGTNRFQEMPIIALTASASAEQREECLRHGMNDHISKPFTAADLEKLFSEWSTQAAR